MKYDLDLLKPRPRETNAEWWERTKVYAEQNNLDWYDIIYERMVLESKRRAKKK